MFKLVRRNSYPFAKRAVWAALLSAALAGCTPLDPHTAALVEESRANGRNWDAHMNRCLIPKCLANLSACDMPPEERYRQGLVEDCLAEHNALRAKSQEILAQFEGMQCSSYLHSTGADFEEAASRMSIHQQAECIKSEFE